MFEEMPEEIPKVPVPEAKELDLDQLTEEERRKLGLEEPETSTETPETAN
ncbi:MAG: hypothetical protein KBD27_01645 [Candidatus Moranbacteria bacterium]|nr:hypothetical protein [Candidatus Moranbacteria bacterium]